MEGRTTEEIGYHLHLLLEAGRIRGADTTHTLSKGPEAIATGLTWKGHEFLDAARDDTRWTKAMALVKEKAGSVSIAVLTQLLNKLLTSSLGMP